MGTKNKAKKGRHKMKGWLKEKFELLGMIGNASLWEAEKILEKKDVKKSKE